MTDSDPTLPPAAQRALAEAARCDSVSTMLATARGTIEASDMARIDYLELVDAETLQAVEGLERPAILAVAVFYGDVRLIDHIGIGAG